MDDIKEYTFEFELKIKGCNTVYSEGFNPGVLVKQQVVYKLTETQRNGILFELQLRDDYQDFINRNIDYVPIKEIK